MNQPLGADRISELLLQTHEDIKSDKTNGGTTLIYSIVKGDIITISYLGNGAIIQTTGDFAKLPKNFEEINHAYRFVNLMLPHVDEHGTLTRHISLNSNQEELKPDIITLQSERPEGLVYIFATDGISTLEEQVIISDQQGRKWRNESSSIVSILNRLDLFLKENSKIFNSELLKIFIEDTLEEFKLAKNLEDDASLGLIVSENVINYYKTLIQNEVA